MITRLIVDMALGLRLRPVWFDLLTMFVFGMVTYHGGEYLYRLHHESPKAAWAIALLPIGMLFYIALNLYHALALRSHTHSLELHELAQNWKPSDKEVERALRVYFHDTAEERARKVKQHVEDRDGEGNFLRGKPYS